MKGKDTLPDVSYGLLNAQFVLAQCLYPAPLGVHPLLKLLLKVSHLLALVDAVARVQKRLENWRWHVGSHNVRGKCNLGRKVRLG